LGAAVSPDARTLPASGRADAWRQRSVALSSVFGFGGFGGFDRFVLRPEELSTPNGFLELALPLGVDDVGEYHLKHEPGSSSVTIT
jgi:hypothetical protein